MDENLNKSKVEAMSLSASTKHKYGNDIYGILQVLKECNERDLNVVTSFSGCTLYSVDLEEAIQTLNDTFGFHFTTETLEDPIGAKDRIENERMKKENPAKASEKKEIKEALSYSMASDLHEAWRRPRKLEDGTYEPRMKKTKDEEWIKEHGTDEVDIANLSFEELPSDWQYENLEAAKVAIEQVYDKEMRNPDLAREYIEQMSLEVHEAWLSRNDWVYDEQYGNPDQAKPYAELSEEEKNKDREQIRQAIDKIGWYIMGVIDIDVIRKQNGLDKVDIELTPEQVVDASEHVQEFEGQVRQDLIRDEKTNELDEQDDENR